MKRWLLLLALGLFSVTTTGCIQSPPLAADPSVRVYQLLQQSEQLRQTGYDMSRFALFGAPSTLNPVQTTGTVGP